LISSLHPGTARLYEYLQGGTPELLSIEATAHPERAERDAENRVVVGLT
jgi:hypothetical protein